MRAGSCHRLPHRPRRRAYAGGRAIETPFGIVHSTNLTPDAATGLGGWTAADFWRAMHNGRSRDGRLLYPVFPYPNYTRLTRADSDAMFAYLQSLAPVAQRGQGARAALPVRHASGAGRLAGALLPPRARSRPDASRSAEWNRGAYLVETLGHCNACHSRRNVFGATAGPLDLAGGLIPIQNWYAPSLNARDEASVADWPAPTVALLKDGISAHGSVQGRWPKSCSTRPSYLTDADLAAMAAYLQSLPNAAPPTPPAGRARRRRPTAARALYDATAPAATATAAKACRASIRRSPATARC